MDPCFIFIHQPVTLDISQKVPVPWVVWEENSTPSLPVAFLTQKIQNAFGKCLWKVLTALLNPWVLLLKTIHYVEEAARNSLGTLEPRLPQQLALLAGTAAGCHHAAGSAQVTATSSLWARGTQHPSEKKHQGFTRKRWLIKTQLFHGKTSRLTNFQGNREKFVLKVFFFSVW